MARASSLATLETSDVRFRTRGTALARVLEEAPYLPRCSDNKTATKQRPREYAVRFPYMQVNRPNMVSWLVFDLDHPNAYVWDDAGLPAPNLIVRNRDSGHSHLYYAIPPVCTSQRARSAPIDFMRAVYEAMAARLQADPQFHSGPVAKTPGHPWWDTSEFHAHVYELGQLADYVDLANRPKWGKGPSVDRVAHSRHCILFEELRFYAYSIVNRERDKGTFDGFVRLLEAYAHNCNNFAKRGFKADLTDPSIRHTVKSVARWTWDRYTGAGGCHRGVMQLDKSQPLAKRQALAAGRTNGLRKTASASRIRAVCRELQQAGRALVQATIALATGLCRQTVAKYQHILDEVLATPPESVVRPLAKTVTPRPVNYAVHQVAAASSNGAGAVGLSDIFMPIRSNSPAPSG